MRCSLYTNGKGFFNQDHAKQTNDIWKSDVEDLQGISPQRHGFISQHLCRETGKHLGNVRCTSTKNRQQQIGPSDLPISNLFLGGGQKVNVT